MARLHKMIKSFEFEEQHRSDMTLDAGVRLHPRRNRLEIMPVAGYYPTTQNLYARTRLTTPEGVRKWSGFFAILTNQKDAGQIVTDVKFKLNNGTEDLYWDSGSSAWVSAALGDWNTEEEVASNIDQFSSQSIQVVINLSTQNESLTPYVEEVRLLYETDLIFLEDYVVRSFMADLKNNLRPISVYQFDSQGETSVVLDLRTPYEIVDVDSVYNLTADPERFSPLTGTSYDPGTKILTLPAQPSGNRVLVNFLWKPHVVLTQSQSFTELAKIPVVMIEDVSLENECTMRNKPYVIDKATGDGFAFEDVMQADIVMPIRVITDKMRDLHVLSQELERYFANTTELRSRGQDDYYTLILDSVFDDISTPSQKELYTCRLRARVKKAVFLSEDAKPITGVKRLNVTGGNVIFEVTT